MKPPRADDWRAILVRLHRAKEHPFDGRKADMLLCVGIDLSHRARGGSRVALKRTREVFGERLVRRYIAVLEHAHLLEMVVKPARAKGGREPRMAIYEFRDPSVSLPLASTERGSDSWGEKGQRSCSAAVRALEAWQARTLPTSTHKPSCLTTPHVDLLSALLPRVASVA